MSRATRILPLRIHVFSSLNARRQSSFSRNFVEDSLPRPPPRLNSDYPPGFDAAPFPSHTATLPYQNNQMMMAMMNNNQPIELDTWRFVSRLEKHLPKPQPDALLDVLTSALSSSSSTLLNPCVSRVDFDRTQYSMFLDIHELDSSMTRLTRSDFEKMRADVAKMSGEVERLRQRLRQEISQIESGMRLEIGLEKGRIRDLHAFEELKINEAEGKIDQDVSSFKTNIESLKWELLRTLIPIFTATCGLLIAYLRLMR